MAKWSKAQHAKYAATLKRKKSVEREQPLDSHIVDDGLEAERAARIIADNAEHRGFRRGMIHIINLILEDLEPTEDDNV